MPEICETELTDKNMMSREHNRVNSAENFECPSQKPIELDDEEPGTPGSNVEQTFNELIGEQYVVSQPSEEKNAKNEKNDRNVSNDKYVELNETDSREDEHSYAAKEKYDWNVRRGLTIKKPTSREEYLKDEQSELQVKRRTEPNNQLERIRIPKFEGISTMVYSVY